MVRDEVVHDAHAHALFDHGHGGEVLQGGEYHLGGDAIPFEQLQNVIIPTETGHNELFILAVFQGIGVLVRQRMIQGEDCNHGILSQGGSSRIACRICS